jgi:hypothetical protein
MPWPKKVGYRLVFSFRMTSQLLLNLKKARRTMIRDTVRDPQTKSAPRGAEQDVNTSSMTGVL